MPSPATRINQDTHTGPSFSFRNRLARVFWNVVQGTLFAWSPTPLHAWRGWLLRCFGAEVGRDTHIYPGVKIWAPWNLSIGDEAGIASGATLYAQGRISIGKHAVVSQGAYLCAGTHDFEMPGFPLITKPIVIGDEAWVAAQAFVHPGVTIAEGAVIGARSVVTKDVPAWTVCSGFPAKPLRKRRMSGEHPADQDYM